MPPIIEAMAATKSFRQPERFPGLTGAFRRLFTREFIEIVAVKDVSFRIDRGKAVGYLGPNGAGKSTMIKMLTGILLPSRGSVRVLERLLAGKHLRSARRDVHQVVAAGGAAALARQREQASRFAGVARDAFAAGVQRAQVRAAESRAIRAGLLVESGGPAQVGTDAGAAFVQRAEVATTVSAAALASSLEGEHGQAHVAGEGGDAQIVAGDGIAALTTAG